jgi:thiamine biosynthesis lipoprotein
MSLTSFMEKDSNSLIIKQQTICRMHYLMGTFVQIEIVGEQRTQAIEVIEEAFSEMKRVERILSRYLEESQISKINQSAHLFPVKISSEVFQLLEEAIGFSRLTEGAFDITVGPILELWGQAQKRGFAPTRAEIEQGRSSIDYSNVVFDSQKNTIFLKKYGVKIDLGGIGKGYAVDRAIDVLKKNGIKKALINAGGNIFCLDEERLPIGIKNPCNPQDIIATILVKNQAISTSANYERSFSIGGKSYGHLINPQTAYPVGNGMLSVSIISSSAKMADVLSTTVFILGQDKGMQLIENMEDLEGIIITEDNRGTELNTSSGLKEIFPATYLPNLTHKEVMIN